LNSINNTLFIGKVFFHYENLPSTNLLALEMLNKGKMEDGTVISTFAQTDGRGQASNKWESEPEKNLSLSIIFKPDFLPLQKQFLLNQAISLGVYDFVNLYVKNEVKVKWSNDIYIGNEKIAGILIQNITQGQNLQYSVVGIGININQTNFLSPAPNPTSIALATGNEIPLWTAMSFLLKYIENRYLQLRSEQYETLNEDYHEALYRINDWHFFSSNDSIFQGKILGVNETGQLRIDSKDGEFTFNFKEIKFII
jgi:BirA family transcriptional regulator, biotin operon repressor / biotin---[acetyl-CoA-carboxylase] ligase